MTFQILVIENEVKIAKSIKSELEYQGYLVTLAYDGLDGLIKARKSYFDLILLNWMLPNISGIEICRRLRQTKNQVPIIVLTALNTVKERVRILEAGANNYLPKPFAMEELLAKVHFDLSWVRESKRETVKFADLQLNLLSGKVYRGNRSIELTNTEFNLLKYLAAHPKLVLTHQQIFEQVWNCDFLNNRSTIEVHIRHLRQKLEQNNEKRLIQTIRGIGYVLRE